ncbi:FAD-binding oxidoreductase [Aphanothece minutissima]|uniref:FAD-binding protein n=1 Tax=Aphanothece cf. minutissima CCALA 015 TaxID=2107695 RepID=A0ABX5F883_9CHRO|nr:FAD-binding oxidoreductase [Aphanothece minutissima]PSB37879.1 FAD-binding protein [Aphanothece cf. minutissima CCALA 015]
MPDTAIPGRLPAAPDPARIQALAAELAASGLGLTPILTPAELGRLSADFHDYSPVLEPLLKGRRAQLAVKVERVEQVMAVAGACARHRVPLTLRGAGTGNYGQCVPLAGGLVLDMGGLNRLRSLDLDSGVVEAESGCILAQLDGQLMAQGRALRMAPSTYRSATLGGFIAGGSGGLGSLRWGFLRDPGHLLGLEVVTLEAEPRLLRLDAAASAPLNHAYGTNGIITALRMATTEAVAWEQLVVGFARWEEALEASRLLPTTALLLNALCLLEAPVAAAMPWPAGCPAASAGEHLLLLHAAPDSLEALPGWLATRGGRILWQGRRPEPGRGRGLPLGELTWNHTTLHWRAQAPDWTYLQLLLPRPEAPLLEAVRGRWGTDVLWHLEAVRHLGAPRLTALPLVRWQGPEALADLVAQCRALGAVPFDPHVITVEDGGLGVVDADQVAAKAAFDPAGLMNPGKLRGWMG